MDRSTTARRARHGTGIAFTAFTGASGAATGIGPGRLDQFVQTGIVDAVATFIANALALGHGSSAATSILVPVPVLPDSNNWCIGARATVNILHHGHCSRTLFTDTVMFSHALCTTGTYTS